MDLDICRTDGRGAVYFGVDHSRFHQRFSRTKPAASARYFAGWRGRQFRSRAHLVERVLEKYFTHIAPAAGGRLAGEHCACNVELQRARRLERIMACCFAVDIRFARTTNLP